MGIDLPQLLTGMADTNNKNVDALEKSIRSAARLTKWLNVLSALMAFIGLGAQISVYRHEVGKSGKDNGGG